MRVAVVSVPLALLLAAAGPAPPVAGTVDVTLVRPGPQDQPYADAVAQALSDRAFTPMPRPDHGRYIAEVSVERESRGTVLARVPAGHASTDISNWGGGVSVPLGTHNTQLHDLSMVTLTVRLIARADHRLVWSGSAVTADVGRPDTPARLSQAAVASFPATLATIASVP